MDCTSNVETEKSSMTLRRKTFLIGALTLLLAACTESQTTFPVRSEAQADLPANVVVTRLDASNIGNFAQPRQMPASARVPGVAQWNYAVGVGDILSIDVFNHPELTLPAGPNRTPAETGFRIQANGSFAYPFVGEVQAARRAPEEIRAELQQRLSEFITDPQLEVRVAAFNSQSVVVSGAVNEPNRLPLTTVPLTLLEAVNAAGGFTEEADGARVTLQRRGRTYTINFDTFLRGGFLAGNPILINGDQIAVPRRRPLVANLLGDVTEPDVVDLSQDDISLTQAVTQQGGLAVARGDARGIFVFRNADATVNVYQLDTSSPTGYLLGTKFMLAPDDVVYVTTRPLSRWNDQVSSLLSTFSSGVLLDRIATE